MASFTAFFDACVLYPAPLRDLLMELALSDLFRAKWSNAVHEEWIRSVLEDRRDLTRAQLERTRDLMNTHIRDCLVEDYEPLISAVTLPDADDRHVLAAAIKGRADVIVTSNLKDFPAEALAQWDLEAQHPDVFLMHLFNLSQPAFVEAIRTVQQRLVKPPKSPEEYLDSLRRVGLLATVTELENYDQLI